MSSGKHSASSRHFNIRTKEQKLKFKNKTKERNTFNKEHRKSNRNKEKKAIFKKAIGCILILIIIAILAVIVYFGYQYFKEHPIDLFSKSNHDDVSNEEYVEELGEESEKVEPTKPLTVIGAEYLEITGVYVNSDDPKLSTVSSKLKNLSNKEYKNINIRITLFDKDDKEITFLDYKIDKLEANGETITYAALKRDLSNFESYSITLIKTK